MKKQNLIKVCQVFIFLISNIAISQSLNQGLLGRWDLASGSAIDISGNENNGNIYNAIGVPDRHGVMNGALGFNGSGQIGFGNILNMGVEDFSIGAWFKINPANTGVYAIVSKKTYGVGVDNNRIRVYFRSTSTLDIRMGLISDDSWHYVAVTFDRDGSLKVYLDGVVIGSRDISSSETKSVQSSDNLYIGRYESPSYRFRGNIDDVRIYNRILSEEEIGLLSSFSDSNCADIIIRSEENVGIGELPHPNYGLAIGGSIYTDEVKVTNVSDWPDYVFSSGYDLMNLQRLESYIKSYGHLPDVPSSEEVFSNGISLAEMDKVNLKKLEELSLYLIDQHNRLKELDAVKENVTVSWKPRANVSAWVERSGRFWSSPSIDSLSLGLSCQGDNVGINTSDTGGYRLGVTGGILSEGVKVESISNWPDYVFSADYSLRSLDELEAYIEANRHLPGLPSAKAIESEGYSLSEMDRLLMEKVEELTLYIIDQERHLTELSKELGIDFPTKSHKWPGTSENLLAENSESHYKDYTKKEVQILAEVSGTFTSPLCDAISCNGEEVGIGTDPLEGYHLAVAGGILTDDIQVASVSNWPDYVFEPNYKLRDLSDLSNYIESKGHLPGVPKAEVVEQEGYRLETMDALLLEKIEELTLYLIGQERLVTFLENKSLQ